MTIKFLESKAHEKFSAWCGYEIKVKAQDSNIRRHKDGTLEFTEYNFLPTSEKDILDGHYTFLVDPNKFRYCIYKSSDYGSLTYVRPVKIRKPSTARSLPIESKKIVEAIIANKLLRAIDYETKQPIIKNGGVGYKIWVFDNSFKVRSAQKKALKFFNKL